MKNAQPHNKARPSASSNKRDFKQLSLLPESPKPRFNPTWPSRGTKTEKALLALLTRDMTHADWIEAGQGWRLSASIHELKNLGWEPISRDIPTDGGADIASYSLSPKAKRFAVRILHREGTQ